MIFDKGIPAYATREFRNFGLYKAGDLYKYLFTREDNILLNSGAIKLLPKHLCKYYLLHDTVLSDGPHKMGEELKPSSFDDNTLNVLVKTNVLRCELADSIKNKDDKDIVKMAKLYECVGNTFKQVSTDLGLDFEVVKTEFDLKQGGNNKKVKEKDLEKLNKILLGV